MFSLFLHGKFQSEWDAEHTLQHRCHGQQAGSEQAEHGQRYRLADAR